MWRVEKPSATVSFSVISNYFHSEYYETANKSFSVFFEMKNLCDYRFNALFSLISFAFQKPSGFTRATLM